MTKAIYASIDGKAKKVKSVAFGLNGLAKSVASVWGGVDGVARNVLSKNVTVPDNLTFPSATYLPTTTGRYLLYNYNEKIFGCDSNYTLVSANSLDFDYGTHRYVNMCASFCGKALYLGGGNGNNTDCEVIDIYDSTLTKSLAWLWNEAYDGTAVNINDKTLLVYNNNTSLFGSLINSSFAVSSNGRKGNNRVQRGVSTSRYGFISFRSTPIVLEIYDENAVCVSTQTDSMSESYGRLASSDMAIFICYPNSVCFSNDLVATTVGSPSAFFYWANFDATSFSGKRAAICGSGSVCFYDENLMYHCFWSVANDYFLCQTIHDFNGSFIVTSNSRACRFFSHDMKPLNYKDKFRYEES